MTRERLRRLPFSMAEIIIAEGVVDDDYGTVPASVQRLFYDADGCDRNMVAG
jgi:hypothetical protein